MKAVTSELVKRMDEMHEKIDEMNQLVKAALPTGSDVAVKTRPKEISSGGLLCVLGLFVCCLFVC